MAQTIKLKRSATAGNIPSTSNIALGEVAINTTDGKMFIKRSVGGTESIVQVGDTSAFLPLSGGSLTGNLNIGSSLMVGSTTAPEFPITAYGSSNQVYIGSVTPSVKTVLASDETNLRAYIGTRTNHPISFVTDGDERMRIRSDGYIDMAGASDVRLTLGSQGTAGNNDANWIRGNGNALSFNSAAGNYIWEVGGSPKMTLKADGTLLVGKTTSNVATAGHEFFNYGRAIHTVNASTVQIINRLSNDGDLTIWQKNGSTVGNLGVYSGSLFVGGGDVGLGFYQGADALVPFNPAANTRDAAIDLGMSSSRFKDLYITGLNVTYSTYNKISSYFSGSYTSGFKFSDMNGGIWYDAGTDDLTVSAGHANSQLILESGGSTALTIDSSQNVGIGTTAPSAHANLHIAGAPYAFLALEATNSGGRQYEFFSYALDQSFHLYDRTAQAYRMTVDETGNVGIGRAPDTVYSGSLQFALGNGSQIATSTTGNPSLTITDNSYLNASGNHVYKTTNPSTKLEQYNGTLVFSSAASGTAGATISYTERMAIDSSGAVNISGSASGTEQFRVGNSTGGTDFGITVTENSGVVLNSAEGSTARTMTFSTGGSPKMTLLAGGDLLVNKTSTANTASGVRIATYNGMTQGAVGTGLLDMHDFYRGTEGSLTRVGHIRTTGTSTSYNTSSDQRLKDNIADADDSGSKVDAIQVRKFDWKADGTHQDYGMVAQELKTVAPEAVSGDADSDEMMSVDYSKLVPMLIKEIQTLRQRVASLEV